MEVTVRDFRPCQGGHRGLMLGPLRRDGGAVIGEQAVDILDNVTLEVVDHCYGPFGGACSRAGVHGVVGCAGHRIDPGDGRPEYVRLQVLPGTRHCPLAWDLEAFGM
jgi:hypothetical protein